MDVTVMSKWIVVGKVPIRVLEPGEDPMIVRAQIRETISGEAEIVEIPPSRPEPGPVPEPEPAKPITVHNFAETILDEPEPEPEPDELDMEIEHFLSPDRVYDVDPWYEAMIARARRRRMWETAIAVLIIVVAIVAALLAVLL